MPCSATIASRFLLPSLCKPLDSASFESFDSAFSFRACFLEAAHKTDAKADSGKSHSSNANENDVRRASRINTQHALSDSDDEKSNQTKVDLESSIAPESAPQHHEWSTVRLRARCLLQPARNSQLLHSNDATRQKHQLNASRILPHFLRNNLPLEALVSRRTLYRLKCIHGSLVELGAATQQQSGTDGNTTIVRLLALQDNALPPHSDQNDCDTIYLSPASMHQLSLPIMHNQMQHQSATADTPHSASFIQWRHLSHTAFHLPIATHCRLIRIATPATTGSHRLTRAQQHQIDSNLKQLLRYDMILQQNQVLCVPLCRVASRGQRGQSQQQQQHAIAQQSTHFFAEQRRSSKHSQQQQQQQQQQPQSDSDSSDSDTTDSDDALVLPRISASNASATQPNTVPLAYFRVIQLHTASTHHIVLPFARCSARHTTLVQEKGWQLSTVPYAMQCFMYKRRQLSDERLQLMSELQSSENQLQNELLRLYSPLLAQLQQSSLATSSSVVSSARASASSLGISVLIRGPPLSGKRHSVRAVCESQLNLHVYEINLYRLMIDAISGSEKTSTINHAEDESRPAHALTNLIQHVVHTIRPCVIHLRCVDATMQHFASQPFVTHSIVQQLRNAMDCLQRNNTVQSNAPVLLVASCRSLDGAPMSQIKSMFSHTISVEPLTLEDRKRVLQHALQQTVRIADESVHAHAAADQVNAVTSTSTELNLNKALEGSNSGLNQSASDVSSVLASQTSGMTRASLQQLVTDSIRCAAERLASQKATQLRRVKSHAMHEQHAVLNSFYASPATSTQTKTTPNSKPHRRSSSASSDESMQLTARALPSVKPLGSRSISQQPTEITAAAETLSDSDSDAENDPLPLVRIEDLNASLAFVKARQPVSSASLSSSPNVHWSDIGGLHQVKREILEMIEMPRRFPQLFASGLAKRSGVLLYGPPGGGKTLIGKAVATECRLPFLSIKGPELLNMYIGESEANIRAVFQQARSMAPCVLFFDEVDALAPARASGGGGGGGAQVMERIVSQLLTEMDELSTRSRPGNEIYIIAATNRPDLIDSALLRPGRLERCVYLGIASTDEDQLHVMRALTRKFKLDPDVQLDSVVTKLSKRLSGADLYSVASAAMLLALKRRIKQVEQQAKEQQANTLQPVNVRALLDRLPKAELAVAVSQDDFLQAAAAAVPSLSVEELKHYERLRDQFSDKQKTKRDASTGKVKSQPAIEL